MDSRRLWQMLTGKRSLRRFEKSEQKCKLTLANWDHEYHLAQAIPAYRKACYRLKTALDPNDIIAPGRYGIG